MVLNFSTVVIHAEQYEYLGNVVDLSLTLNADFDQKYKKVTKRLQLLSKIRPLLSNLAAERIHNMMVTPIITYCSQLHASPSATQIKKLSAISLRATNLIDNPSSTVMSMEKLMGVKNCLYEDAQKNVSVKSLTITLK